MKKFELTSNTRIRFGKTLYQLKALISFGIVKAGDLGGYVEKESNLDHFGNAWVYGDAEVSGNAWVYGDAEVSGNARVYGNAWVYGNARVYGNADYLTIGPIGSRDAFTTFYRRNDGVTMVVCGCFHGTIDEFEKAVSETHGDSPHAVAYRAVVQVAKARVNTEPSKESENE